MIEYANLVNENLRSASPAPLSFKCFNCGMDVVNAAGASPVAEGPAKDLQQR